MLMKKLLSNINVAPIYDEIHMNLWENHISRHNPVTWKNTGGQILVEYEGHQRSSLKSNFPWEPFNKFNKYIGSLPEDMKDMFLPDFWPTENYFYYPQTHKFLHWFTKTYGGKFARVIYYNTQPKNGVGTHADGGRLSPDDDGWPMFADKDRFSLVVSGEYTLTVDEETEYLKTGDLWWFANKLPHVHSSYNHGDTSKTNLIFDIEGSHWRE
jgi:hypothetical protein|tara:strand:- start:818 stop:1453 length:636 start_codon:yes stop_codon:yes gene_type:complete